MSDHYMPEGVAEATGLTDDIHRNIIDIHRQVIYSKPLGVCGF